MFDSEDPDPWVCQRCGCTNSGFFHVICLVCDELKGCWPNDVHFIEAFQKANVSPKQPCLSDQDTSITPLHEKLPLSSDVRSIPRNSSDAAQLPSTKRGQDSRPNPETVVHEEEVEKYKKGSTTSRPGGKQEWVKVPYTPSVVFNTPLPNRAATVPKPVPDIAGNDIESAIIQDLSLHLSPSITALTTNASPPSPVRIDHTAPLTVERGGPFRPSMYELEPGFGSVIRRQPFQTSIFRKSVLRPNFSRPRSNTSQFQFQFCAFPESSFSV